MAIANNTPPKVSYGSGPTVLTWTYPVKPWDLPRGSVGGQEWSATGIPASYCVRRDGDLALTLRVTEAELAATIAWIEGVQAPAIAFDFWLDSTGASVSCYLVSPAAGETIKPTRTEFGPVLELPVTLRRVDGAAWTVAYFG